MKLNHKLTRAALYGQVAAVGVLFFFGLVQAPNISLQATALLSVIAIVVFLAALRFMTVSDFLEQTKIALDLSELKNKKLREGLKEDGFPEADPFILAALQEAERTGKPVIFSVTPTENGYDGEALPPSAEEVYDQEKDPEPLHANMHDCYPGCGHIHPDARW